MKKYEKLMDQVRLTDEMRERIRTNIQNADLSKTPIKKPVRFPYKRYLPLAASFVLLVVGAVLLTRLSPSQEQFVDSPAPATSQTSSAVSHTSAVSQPSAPSQLYASSQLPPASQPSAVSQPPVPSQASGVSQPAVVSSQPSGSEMYPQTSQPPIASQPSVSALPPPTVSQPTPGNVDGNNGIMLVNSAEALREKVGFAAPSLSHLPFEVESISYTAYGSELAEVTYQGQDQTANVRKSLGKEDNSGVYRIYRTTETLTLNQTGVTLSGFSSDELVMAVWQKDGVSYSVVLSDGISIAEWEAVLQSLQ